MTGTIAARHGPHDAPSGEAQATSVYVHVPWCVRRCPYCDFATRAVEPAAIAHERYADAVLRELEQRAPALEGRRLVSVFFGGGTPSLWSPQALGRVLRGIVGAFGARLGELEVSVECNPGSFEDDRAAQLVEVGVTRLSIGVQSLDEATLAFLGRAHDARQALRSVRSASECGAAVSADLIIGVATLSAMETAAQVAPLVEAGARHVSAYVLTIEPGTRFGALHRAGRLPIRTEDDVVETYWRLADACAAVGLEHYEVSNHAAPGQRCVHNLHYWRAGDYVGLGAAAVGCLLETPGRARRWRNEPDPDRYMALVEAGRLPEADEERLGPAELVREGLMLGLRTDEGADMRALARRAGVEPSHGRAQAIARRIERGDLVRDEQRLRVPRSRWLVLDSIVVDLF
ncbi:MAG: radical SAM family heme chaperone HemW [Myxococcales bacterium]|nr:radical SAM family heme chaperone HemW [Myxococcales bacterium]